MLDQASRQIRLSTPLPPDTLAFKSMRMHETLGRMFEMHLEFYSDDGEIKFDDLLGHQVNIELDRSQSKVPRYFHAYLSSIGFAGSRGRRYIYQATGVPWLWFLTRTEDCRIFHNKKAEDIIKEIFGEHKFSDFKFDLTGSYPKYEYCVQYRESDFNFVSRLLEREGMYYYFVHEKDKHTMVITDAQSKHDPEPGYNEYEYFARDEFSERRREGVFGWRPRNKVMPNQVSLTDYDFKKPRTDISVDSKIARQHGLAGYEIFDYPGVYFEKGEGKAYAKTRIEELQAEQSIVRADSNLRGVKTGRKFKLISHPIKANNIDYLVTSATYEMTADDYESGGDEAETFHCSFTALNTKEVFRPARITQKPVIPGPQTAVGFGKEGEEIDPDEHGRVKVQFRWERENKYSLPVRVSQPWAGNGWGGMFIPRIGQEVIVEFEEGDPDRPIITGRVYNGIQKNPYEPPDNRNISTIRTNTVKGTGFNELRFDDTAGEEEIFIHAQHNMDTRILNDAKRVIKNDHHEIIENEELREIRAERHETVDHDVFVTHKDNHNLDIGSNFLVKSGSDTVITAQGSAHIKATRTAVVEAPQGVTLKCGGNFVTLDMSGVHIQGTIVNINSGGSALQGPGTQPEQARLPEEAVDQTGGEKDPLANPVSAAIISARESRKPFCAICNA